MGASLPKRIAGAARALQQRMSAAGYVPQLGFPGKKWNNCMFFFVRTQYFPVSDVYIGKVLLKFYNDEENFVCNGGGRVTGF